MPSSTPRHLLLSAAVGALAGALGLLPWLVTGMRLPVQNLWATESTPETMPIALLPFSQYSVVLIVAVIVTGSALAGLAVRTGRRLSPLGAALGAVGVQVVALVQSAATVAGGLEDRSASTLYLAALVSGTVIAIASGLAILLLLAVAPRPGATFGITLAAVAAGSWLAALVAPVGSTGGGSPALLGVVQWLPGVLAGLGLAWCGLASAGRAIAWGASLLALWIVPTLVIAVSSATSTRAMGPHPLEILDYARQVFQTALLIPAVSLRTPAVALIVGAVGVALLTVRRRRRA